MNLKTIRTVTRGLVACFLCIGWIGCTDDQPRSSASVVAEDADVDTGGTDTGLADGTGGTDTDLADVAPADVGVCQVVYQAADGTDAFSCDIPLDTMLGCDELARCMCEAQRALRVDTPDIDINRCIESLVFPRGAITFADTCVLSGSDGARSLPEMLSDASITPVLVDFPMLEDHAVTLSPSCQEVANFTLWGESPTLQMSVGLAGESTAWPTSDLESYRLEPTPLVTLPNVQAFDAAAAELHILDPTVVRDALNAMDDGLVGRFFIFHSDTRPLLNGRFVSHVMSASVEDPTIAIEDFEASDYQTLTLSDGYPANDRLGPDLTGTIRAQFAASKKLRDASCISSCGCHAGTVCREGRCEPVAACAEDADCCLGTCDGGSCR